MASTNPRSSIEASRPSSFASVSRESRVDEKHAAAAEAANKLKVSGSFHDVNIPFWAASLLFAVTYLSLGMILKYYAGHDTTADGSGDETTAHPAGGGDQVASQAASTQNASAAIFEAVTSVIHQSGTDDGQPQNAVATQVCFLGCFVCLLFPFHPCITCVNTAPCTHFFLAALYRPAERHKHRLAPRDHVSGDWNGRAGFRCILPPAVVRRHQKLDQPATVRGAGCNQHVPTSAGN